VRRGARWALEIGVALVATAAVSGAGADVLSIDLDECSAGCLAPGIDYADSDQPVDDIPLSLFGSRGAREAKDTRADLIFDSKALPPTLVEGLPSPIASVGAQTPESPGVSPYAFFKEVIDIPLSIDPRTGLAAASINLFAPSLIGRVTLTDVLSDSNALFKPTPRPEM
jgi:hypothetical protein